MTLSEDQVAALEFINTTRSPLLVITALAGTGKTTLAGIILDVYLREMPKGEAVVILVPSRTLRDEHAVLADFGLARILDDAVETTGLAQSGENLTGEAARQKFMCSRVLWLGRPAEDALINMLETQVFEATQQVLAEQLGLLEER